MCQLVNMYSCMFDESKERHWVSIKHMKTNRDRVKFINLAYDTESYKRNSICIPSIGL